MRTGHTMPSSGGHSLQRDKTADVVGEVLEADFGFRPSNANRPYDPTTRRGLLSAEHVLERNTDEHFLASLPPPASAASKERHSSRLRCVLSLGRPSSNQYPKRISGRL